MTLKYRAVLFDLDDTIFDHQAHRREALVALGRFIPSLSEISLKDIESVHETQLQRTHLALLDGKLTVSQARTERMRGLLNDFGIEADDALADTCEEIYRAAYNRKWRAVPGARELLTSLRKLGIWIGVITNGLELRQAEKLRALRLENMIDEMIVSEKVGSKKPAQSFFEYALTRADVSPNECIVVGDLWETDIQGALNMGLDSIWLNRYGRTCEPTAKVMEVTSLLPTAKMVKLFLKDVA
jgi:HAD superfamily hydrolase (TIGR01662 family)